MSSECFRMPQPKRRYLQQIIISEHLEEILKFPTLLLCSFHKGAIAIKLHFFLAERDISARVSKITFISRIYLGLKKRKEKSLH